MIAMYCTFTYLLCQFSRVWFDYIIRWKHWLSSLPDWVFQVKLCVFIPDISMIHTSLQYLDWKNSKVFPSLHYIMCLICKAEESDIFKTNYLCTWQQNTFDICFDLQIPKRSLLLQHVISLSVRVRIYWEIL